MKAWLRRRALRRKVLELAEKYQYFCELESDGPSVAFRAIAREDAENVLSRIAENLRLGEQL